MVSNKLTVLAASAVLVESALGLHNHHHLHAKHIKERAVETDWVTEWVTVYVTPDACDELPASCTGAASSEAAKAVISSSIKPYVPPAPPAPTTTSTTVVVVPTSTSIKVPEQPKSTLSTYIKPAAPETEVAVKVTSKAPAPPHTTAVAPVAAPTTTKAAAKPPPKASSSGSSSSGTGISKKRGMAFNDAALCNTFHENCPNCGWAYNWGDNKGDLDSSIPFIPTMWGPSHAATWETNANSAIAAGSKVLFSFNEPDIATQSTLSPADAAKYHIQYMNPFSSKALIAAPSVSNSGSDGQGLSYLAQWIEACNGECHFDFCNIHWYSEAQYSDTLFTQIEKAHEVCGGKPIWLTEFAPTDNDPNVKNDFMKKVIPKLDQIDYLEGYSYFMVGTDNLMSDQSSLSEFGQSYASA